MLPGLPGICLLKSGCALQKRVLQGRGPVPVPAHLQDSGAPFGLASLEIEMGDNRRNGKGKFREIRRIRRRNSRGVEALAPMAARARRSRPGISGAVEPRKPVATGCRRVTRPRASHMLRASSRAGGILRGDRSARAGRKRKNALCPVSLHEEGQVAICPNASGRCGALSGRRTPHENANQSPVRRQPRAVAGKQEGTPWAILCSTTRF